MRKARRHFLIDILLVAVSFVVAIYIVESGVVHILFDSIRSLNIVGIVLAGMLFTSIFTTIPAIALIAELAQHTTIFPIAFWGGLGAALGDYLIFWFVRERGSDDVNYILKLTRARKTIRLLKTERFRWLSIVIGSIIIVSPLPDEIGLAMIGLSRISTAVFLPLTFVLNAGGIALIAVVAQALLPI